MQICIAAGCSSNFLSEPRRESYEASGSFNPGTAVSSSTDTAREPWRIYVDAVRGFQIEIPPDYIYSEPADTSINPVVLIVYDPTNPPEDYNPAFTVSMFTIQHQSPEPSEVLLAEGIDPAASTVKEMAFAGCPAKEIIVDNKVGGTPVDRQILLTHNHRNYVLQYTPVDDTVFQKIASTFTFTDKC